MAELPKLLDFPENLPSEERVNILLVDDQPANLLALEVTLQELGHNLVKARSGEEALQRLLGDDFAVVLLDVQMPGLDGFETAKLIRGRKASRHTPIIFLTAFESDRFPVEQAYSLGAVDYLVKPLVPVIVRAKVAGFVELFEKTQQIKRQAERLRQVERREFEHKLAEENVRLQQQREQLRVTLASIGDAVIATDAEGRVTILNPVACSLTGWTPEEAHGKPLPDVLKIVNEKTRQPVENPALRALTEGVIVGLANHTILIAKDGMERSIEDSAAPIRDNAGVTVGVVISFRDVTERRRHEDEAHKNLEVLKLAQIAGRIGHWEWNSLTDENKWSPEIEALYGLPPGGFEGTYDGWAKLLHPDDLAKAEADVRRAMETGEYFTEFRVIWPDGSVHWLETRANVFKDGQDKAVRIVGVNMDVTARKRAEEERRQSDQRTRIVLESITDAFFAVDQCWRFSYVNPQAERLLDRKPGDLLGQVIWDVYPGLVGSEFEQAYRRAATERVTQSVTSYYPDHDRWYEVHVYPATDGISIYFQDVSERKRAEAEVDRLREASEQQRRIYETALSNSADFNYVFDLEGRFQYVNQALLALWGKPLHEAVGKNFFDLDYPHALAARLQRQIQEVIDTKQPVKDETPYTSTVGERQYEYIFVPVLAADGSVEAVAGSTRDITDRKLVEQALRDADRRKDEFLATLAHELRNPLAPIRNSLQILKMSRLDAATIERTREMMERQVHQLVRLVDDLLDVSRVMRGKIELRRERVELATVVARAVEMVQPLIETQGHELTVQLPPESLPLEADPVRLAQVFGNLLTNAAKYTEAHGRIWLTAQREGGAAVLRVRDTGIGIAPDMLPQIFELFVQVDHATTRSQGGLGIGLTLVKSLVEMHHGTVEAHSAGLRRGSEFVIRLPLMPQEERQRNEEDNGEAPHEPARSSGHRLLVVDDNRDAADSLAMLLRLQGHEVRVAHDGLAALELAKGYRPEMVFLDIGMPGMDGYEVARRLRRQPGLENVRLAALTGWGQAEDRRRTAEAGFDHHLVKPAEPNALESLLSGLRQ